MPVLDIEIGWGNAHPHLKTEIDRLLALEQLGYSSYMEETGRKIRTITDVFKRKGTVDVAFLPPDKKKAWLWEPLGIKP